MDAAFNSAETIKVRWQLDTRGIKKWHCTWWRSRDIFIWIQPKMNWWKMKSRMRHPPHDWIRDLIDIALPTRYRSSLSRHVCISSACYIYVAYLTAGIPSSPQTSSSMGALGAILQYNGGLKLTGKHTLHLRLASVLHPQSKLSSKVLHCYTSKAALEFV